MKSLGDKVTDGVVAGDQRQGVLEGGSTIRSRGEDKSKQPQGVRPPE